MEAARVSALRGHRVYLYESTGALGGHVLEGAVPDFKIDDKRLLEWYRREMKELGIKVSLNAAVSGEDMIEAKPDVLFVATGSQAAVPPITGLNMDDPRVLTTRQALLGEKELGDQVVIIGGGLVGCEMALWFTKNGKKITIVERLPELMTLGDVPYPNKMMLLELLTHHEIPAITGVSVDSVTDSGVDLGKDGELAADSIILATGYRAENSLYQALESRLPQVYLIGDALSPENIKHAVWTAYEVARQI